MPTRIPRRLRKGDLLGVICPASPVADAARIERGVRYLESLGYRVTVGANAAKSDGYLAGTDAERVADLHAMFADRRVKGIFCARGGYGSGRLLPLVDYRLIALHPKVFVGYSDVTALELALWKKCSLVTYHGPMSAVEMAGDIDPFTEESLWRTLTSAASGMTVGTGEPSPGPHRTAAEAGQATAKAGQARGRLIGGNLSLITSIMGTPWQPDFRGRILFLEEIGEDPYRVDRMLVQLAHAGAALRAAGTVFGQFTECVPREIGTPTRSLESSFADFAARSRGPVVRGFPVGHERRMATVPIGLRARLYAGTGALTLEEAPVA
ncbi:MAG TPA: LD-carboxypeptidase [Bacteroidota bacterium]|nr:LD-carboxypeptidase [Bacteroidota bacterium]